MISDRGANPASKKVGLFRAQANGYGLSTDLACPLVGGTMETRWRTLARATRRAEGHEAPQQRTTAEAAELAEGALELLVKLVRWVVHREDLDRNQSTVIILLGMLSFKFRYHRFFA